MKSTKGLFALPLSEANRKYGYYLDGFLEPNLGPLFYRFALRTRNTPLGTPHASDSNSNKTVFLSEFCNH